MNWIVPSVIMVSAALLLEGLVTGLGSGFLACLAIFLAKDVPTINEEGEE